MPRQQQPTPRKPQPPVSTEHLPFMPGTSWMSPGDEAPAGTPGTGENVCRGCAGTGRHQNEPCIECGGSGYVITGIGGA